MRALKPDLKIGYFLEQDVPQAGAMARLPFRRGVLPGVGDPFGGKVLPPFRRGVPPFRRGPCSSRSQF